MLQLDSKAADGFKHSWRISGLQDKDTLRGCPVRTIRKLFMSCCLENPTNHWKHLPRCKNVLCEMAKSFRWTICRAMFYMKAISFFVLWLQLRCHPSSFNNVYIFTYDHCCCTMLLGKFLRISRIIGLTWHTRTYSCKLKAK